MNASPRSDAQKYGLGAIVVAVAVLVLFRFLSGAYPVAPATPSSATTTSASDSTGMSK
jgi:hypothetical protein